MPYTPELKELIKIVEKTRPERVAKKRAGEEIPFLSLDERKKRLDFHPDFKEEGRRELAVGPSKGYGIAHEIADLLEATSRVAPDKVDLSEPAYETDVLEAAKVMTEDELKKVYTNENWSPTWAPTNGPRPPISVWPER